MKKSWALWMAVAVALTFLAPSRASAAVVGLSFEELVAESQTVVRGEVVSAVSHWNEGHDLIYTTVTLRAHDYIAGDPEGSTITFEVPGGTVGDLSLAVSDVPAFIVGEEVVLFLRDEYFRLVGWYQGKYTIRDEVVQGRRVPYSRFREQVLSLSTSGVQGVDTPGEAQDMGPEIHEVRATLNRGLLPDNGTAGPPPAREMAGTAVVMTEDFEGTFPSGSWSLVDQSATDGGEYLWGVDDYDKYAGTYSMWCAAGGADALDPEFDNYVNNMDTWAIYGPFDLSDAFAAELRFMRRTMNADTGDRLSWLASHDGVDFAGYQGFGFVSWVETTLDLTNVLGDDMTGDDSVWIAFRFTSSASGTNKGPWVDDIVLEKSIGPVIDSITPDNGPSGAGFSVTIEGTQFGATQGGSYVTFFSGPDADDRVASSGYSSWSDTQIVCEVPQSASSGHVYVVVDGIGGLSKYFTVTYAASGRKWPDTEPMGEDVLIYPNTADVIEELRAVVKGMQEWNTDGEATFSFTYGGETTLPAPSYNGVNVVRWGSTGGSLATTYTWFSGWRILESDMVFDDVWDWSTSVPPPSGHYDVQNIATHEFGHYLMLLDLYGSADSHETMYGWSSPGQTNKRTIETEDRDGIRYIYGAATVNVTSRVLPGGEVGKPYNYSLVAVGGATPYDWALRGSLTLPPGLSLGADGTISGTPTTTGIYYFNVRVTDDDSDTDSQVLFINVDEDATGPDVAILTPNGGETWYIGESHDITWTASDVSGVDYVDIYYTVNGGDSYDVIASGETNDGVYPWPVPDAPTDSALVKVIAYDGLGNAAEDTSDELFSIAAPPDTTDPTVTVLTPNGGETWIAGSTEDITWSAADANGVDSVSIFYSANDGDTYDLIASGEANDGVYPWDIPDTPTDSALVRVIAYDPSFNTGEDTSDGLFTIAPPPDTIGPDVTVLAPDGGDSLEINTGYDITWTATDANGVDSVSIYYSVSCGDTYDLIASGEANDGIYPWTVPNTPSDSVLVKVVAYDPSLNTGEDVSDSLCVIYEKTVDVPGRPQLGDTVLLWQNSPNPFAPGTNIWFYLPETEVVRLEVFDVRGRLVSVLLDGVSRGPGVQTVPWDGRDEGGARLGSGVYFCRLRAGSVTLVKKMVRAQ